MLKKVFLLLIGGIMLHAATYGQSGAILGQDSSRRPIVTAVPFLSIAPDSRSSGMGDAGGALSADANATYWNPAKLVFADKQMGFSLSFSPWLARIVDDMWLAYLSGYRKIDDQQVFGASLRYFDLGSITFTNDQGGTIQVVDPREFAVDVSYARKLSNRFAMSVAGRFIYSNLSGNLNCAGCQTSPGATAAIDIGTFYENDEFSISSYPSTLRLGATITNLGPKLTYTDDNSRDFLPTNLRLSSSVTSEIDGFNKLTLALDINKLLVPSPPQYDDAGNIIAGDDPSDKSLLSGVLGSFSDAPDGFQEELRELMFSIGAEYWYNDLLALRAGYFNEHRLKGARQYFTVGLGFKYTKFAVDFSYLIATTQNHPLENTLRFTIMMNIDQQEAE
ncbi:MAG: type IX secretion system outer membrane channel protein PorV [Flammeovirgaceae bacterium]